jgi:muscleblind
MFQQQQQQQQQQHGAAGNKMRDRLEVCREFARRNCRRSETECRYAHPAEHVQVTDNCVVVCMDSLKGEILEIPLVFWFFRKG